MVGGEREERLRSPAGADCDWSDEIGPKADDKASSRPCAHQTRARTPNASHPAATPSSDQLLIIHLLSKLTRPGSLRAFSHLFHSQLRPQPVRSTLRLARQFTTNMSHSVAYINHKELAELVRNSKSGTDYQVVDVRGQSLRLAWAVRRSGWESLNGG